jgi:hypothetical protein
MRKIFVFIFLLVAFCACTGGGKYSEMRQRLQALNALNRADSVLTATERDEAQTLANYFDRHGTSNDQLLAHYLLGRCYADMREAPMALHCYQEAITRADTLSPDCDFAQLSRVYGQSATIFYQQGLYRNSLDYYDISVDYGYRGKDTLNALRSYAMKATSYDQLQMKDSAILIYTDAIKQLKAYNYNKVAAGFSGLLAFELLNKDKIEEVGTLLNDYEHHSGYFNSAGDIETGREIYYNWKALYYFKLNQLDSAEYYFRKELRTGRDYNNQNCGSHGLAQLFRLKHKLDSADKYSKYSYAMNDSCFVQMTTHEVEQAKAMYDYSRQQEKAQKEGVRAQENARDFWIAVALALTLLLCSSVLFLKYQERKKTQKYQAENLRDLQTSYITAQIELEKLRNNEDLTTLVADKERQVQQLEEKIAQYEQREYGLKQDEIEAVIRKEKAYKDFTRHVNRGTQPTNKEWEAIEQLLAKNLPSFFHLVSVKKHELNENEYRTCFALRLKVSSSQTANLLGLSPSSLTLIRKSLLLKLFNVEGSAADFDNRLMLYY